MNHTIRQAEPRDLEAVNKLLGQVLSVHHEGRPDLFRAAGKKYTDQQLLAIFANPETPVFVYEEDGRVLGYAFCIVQSPAPANHSLNPVRTLYIDDLCVDGQARGKHIGKALFEYVKAYASQNGFYNITLHVWECNPGAKAFYKALGLEAQYTCMEMVLHL